MRHYPHNQSVSGSHATPRRPVVGADLERCLFCAGTAIIKIGKRYKHHEILQRWYCHTCRVSFTQRTAGKGSIYPLKATLESLIAYYVGHTATATAAAIRKRFGLSLHPRTLSRWLAEYHDLTTYARLRPRGRALFTPHQLIRSVRLHHKQVYTYRMHRGKLALILNEKEHRQYRPIEVYLDDMAGQCPHHLFQTDQRASRAGSAFDLTAVAIKATRNHACRLAELVLQTVTHNRRRHDEIQRFMLATDSVTVAVEVPIYLTPEDIAHMQEKLGFHIPLETSATLSGHIDVLQIRNGRVHILDYKPNAHREKPIAQLMVYALALSRRTGLRLYDFVCAWFDEQNYYEFFPLHVVHKHPRRLNPNVRRR
jgi:transposase-like protein